MMVEVRSWCRFWSLHSFQSQWETVLKSNLGGCFIAFHFEADLYGYLHVVIILCTRVKLLPGKA